MDEVEEDYLVSPLSSDILGISTTVSRGAGGAIVPYTSSPSRRGRDQLLVAQSLIVVLLVL
jgi:hypothetical protein